MVPADSTISEVDTVADYDSRSTSSASGLVANAFGNVEVVDSTTTTIGGTHVYNYYVNSSESTDLGQTLAALQALPAQTKPPSNGPARTTFTADTLEEAPKRPGRTVNNANNGRLLIFAATASVSILLIILLTVSLVERTAKIIECGRPVDEKELLLPHGTDPSISKYPWNAGIFKMNETGHDMVQVCGGVLVWPNLVVSAAHCFYYRNSTAILPRNFKVAFGKYFRAWDSSEIGLVQKSDVQNIWVPKRFNINNNEDDIALVELVTSVNITHAVMPICVDWRGELPPPSEDDVGAVVGWDHDTITGLPSNTLHNATVRYVHESADKCLRNDREIYVCSADMKVAESWLSESAAGSSVTFQEHQSKAWFLRGLVSTRRMVKGGQLYATITDASKYTDWMFDKRVRYGRL